MASIKASVGLRGVNNPEDVRTVQRLLNHNRHRIPGGREVADDTIVGPRTITAIQSFQAGVLKLKQPDGRVDPDGRTLKALLNEVKAAQPARPPAVAPKLLRTMRFPLRARPSASYKVRQGHHRYFGAGRKTQTGGYRAHAACDLLAPPGTEILAVDDGEVIQDVYYFYEGTNALEIRHDSGLVVRYGEISRAARGMGKGHRVTRGQVIAYVGRLNSGSSMLHFEAYTGSVGGKLSTPGNVFIRRGDLVDPTGYLDTAMLD